jgi:D-serine deaminase-like pyridoxal phosphate-dependent protein
VQGIGDAAEVVWPTPTSEDELSGGGDALVVPKGSVKLGDYVLFRPVQTEVAIVKFTEIVAVRDGTVRRRWPTFPRPGGSA